MFNDAKESDVACVSPNAGSQASRTGCFSFWPWLALALSSMPITMLLLGYGLTLYVEDRFGVPSASIFGSSMDLIHLGSLPASVIFERTGVWISSGFWSGLWMESWLVSAALCLIALVFALYLVFERRIKSVELYKKFDAFRIRFDRRWKGVILLGGAAVTYPFAIGIVIGIFLFLLVLPVSLVVAGANNSAVFLNNYVISPQECKITILDESKDSSLESITQALCIALDNQNGVEVARGRLMLSTQKVFILLHKDGSAMAYRSEQHTSRVIPAI